MLPFSYEDRHPGTYGTGFSTTNEEPKVIQSLIKKKFTNGLGIASAGEVTFFSLLPKTKESLVLVDHSYRSLRAFCVKAMWLSTIGPLATRKLILETSVDAGKAALKNAVDKVEESLPVTLQRGQMGLYSVSVEQDVVNLRREWYLADLQSLKKATANLHKIKLIHGDLHENTKDRALYDFLYLSNALEHNGKVGWYPNVKNLTDNLLRKGSPVVWVEMSRSSIGSNPAAYREWELKTKVQGYRTMSKFNLSTTKGN